MSEPISIFDAYGKVRTLSGKADKAAIAALSDDQHKTLAEVIAACNARDAAEERVFAARNDVRDKEAAMTIREPGQSTDAEAARAGTVRRISSAQAAMTATERRLAEIKAVSAAQRPGYVPAKAVPNELQAAVDAASAALLAARAELQAATTEHRKLETVAGEAINAWRACLPVMSRDTLMKDHIAKGNADRLARVKRGEPADAPKIVPQYQSELDRIKGAGTVKPPRPLMTARR